MNDNSKAANTKLDDVMIAMDVVDTLRHDERIALRELNDEARRADLIKALREIYEGQGIKVSDRILAEGVKALAAERFSYEPPADGWQRKLALAYVTRDDWGRWVVGAIAGVIIVSMSWYVMFERPRASQAEQLRVELSDTLPGKLRDLAQHIQSEATNEDVAERANRTRDDGLRAAADGDGAKSRAAAKQLRETLATLRAEFEIRIVTRRDELSGLWRIPRRNPNAQNYYLIVEAVQRTGQILPQLILNEETGKRESVKTWAIRVPKSELEAVKIDKNDDGIIQNTVIGTKLRGALQPTWHIPVLGGRLTRW